MQVEFNVDAVTSVRASCNKIGEGHMRKFLYYITRNIDSPFHVCLVLQVSVYVVKMAKAPVSITSNIVHSSL